MRTIERIFVHCTAGSQKATVNDVIKIFKERGFINPGYHVLVTADGKIHQLLPFEKVSNGVKGFNQTSINIAYTGGIDAKGNAVDNRTPEQKQSLMKLLIRLREKYPKAKIMGHRDISPDLNGNGEVDTFERIKECPCFDAMVEYKYI